MGSYVVYRSVVSKGSRAVCHLVQKHHLKYMMYAASVADSPLGLKSGASSLNATAAVNW